MNEREYTLSAQQVLEAQGYRVIGGINGDYFDIPNGLPIGLVVSKGELKSTDAGLYAIGFRADGSAMELVAFKLTVS